MKPLEHRLVNEVLLMEKNTHVVFSEDFKIYFLSLSQVSQEWEDCKTELERRLYLIKNMENLNKNSKPYLTGEYDEMFDGEAGAYWDSMKGSKLVKKCSFSAKTHI